MANERIGKMRRRATKKHGEKSPYFQRESPAIARARTVIDTSTAATAHVDES